MVPVAPAFPPPGVVVSAVAAAPGVAAGSLVPILLPVVVPGILLADPDVLAEVGGDVPVPELMGAALSIFLPHAPSASAAVKARLARTNGCLLDVYI